MMCLPPSEGLRHSDLRRDRGRPLHLLPGAGRGERVVVGEHLERSTGARGEITAAGKPKSDRQCAEESSRGTQRQGWRANSTAKSDRSEAHEILDRQRKIVSQIVDLTVCDLRLRDANRAFSDGVRVHDRKRGPSAAAQRKEAATHHGADARNELAVSLAVHHRGSNDRTPNVPGERNLQYDLLLT